jgi:hypothetical protein
MLQNRASLARDWQIVYYAFDLLELEGEDLKRRPLAERKHDCSNSSLGRTCATCRVARFGRGRGAYHKGYRF